uniref:DUF1619 domain-containing protein n=1 Tax=Elaeophora elaphi TaxID=1147741 RepID=A0A0R3RRS0_9BILA
MSTILIFFGFFILNLSCIFADICIKSVFLHSIKPLNPSNELFCIVRQNENVGATKAAPFRTINHFRKHLPPKQAAISAPDEFQEGIVEVWNDEKVTAFEYPAAVFSDQCTGTVPLPLSMNVSITCMPQWNAFDEKHCISLKYLNVSYYLRKYSTKKNGNRTIVSMESIPEKSHLISWSYWNGTACINAVSTVSMKFITHNGLLEDISANVYYANITKQSYLQQFYQFNAIFVEILSASNIREVRKPLGYEMGQIIRIESNTNGAFSIPSGMECNNGKQRVNVRFGIQINTACRLRITTCAEILDQIQNLLNEWNEIIVYSLPQGTNKTITMRNERFSSPETLKKEMDGSCELTTAASIQFAYVRFGNVQSYSHRLISYEIELSKMEVIDLTSYPYQYLFDKFECKVCFQTILYAAFVIKSTTALGGILGLKALTGNMPYFGFGNPWITLPRVAHGGANLYSPYSLWGYGSSGRGIFGGYGNTGIYHSYQRYIPNQFTSQSLIRSPFTIPSGLSNSLTTASGSGQYYRGRGNPWITQ